MLNFKLFYLINHGCSNFIFDRLMPLVTFLGDGKFMLALAILLVIIVRKPKKMAGILMLAGLAISRFTVHYLKGLWLEPRPFAALKDVHLLVAEMDKSHSFPSGHATLAFMAAVILAGYFRRGYLFFLIAIAVCFSRVYVGVHYVSDVIAGALLGAAIGLILVFAGKKIYKG